MASLADLKRSQLRQKGTEESTPISAKSLSDPTSDLEIFAKEVLSALISDNLPPTPNNFSLYFDRILDDKSESLKRQIGSILELEENNDDEHETKRWKFERSNRTPRNQLQPMNKTKRGMKRQLMNKVKMGMKRQLMNKAKRGINRTQRNRRQLFNKAKK